MKKIAITGGFGFIGHRLINHFISKNIDIIVLEHPEAKIPNNFPDVEVILFNILENDKEKLPIINNCDAMLHLAAQSSGPQSFFIPETDINLNVLGTLNTINLCLKNTIEKLLFASSFVVYGDHPEKEKLDENTYCLPKSVYAGSKLAAEHLIANFAEPNGIEWNVLRMFNVYGPGQDISKQDQGVVGIFLNMLLNGNNVDIKGSLNRFRDLIFIDDVISAWDLCLHKGKKNQIYNVGSGEKTTYNELIHNIAIALNKERHLVINELENTPGDLLGCYADISKSTKQLGFKPETDLLTGLNKFINWVNNK